MNQYTIQQFIVDAFTDTVFKGNPAAVCLLDKWLSDDTLQNIAKENNLSETAFTVKNDDYISELKSLKELLDIGVITEEEFSMKKKQILGI